MVMMVHQWDYIMVLEGEYHHSPVISNNNNNNNTIDYILDTNNKVSIESGVIMVRLLVSSVICISEYWLGTNLD